MLLKQTAAGPGVFLQLAGGRLNGVALAETDRLVQPIGRKIDAGGGGEVRDASLWAGMTQVLGMLGLGLLLGGGDDHRDAHEHLDGLRIAAGCLGGGAYLVDLGAGGGFVLAADEHAFGMVAGERQATRGAARLEQHRCALR
ncbi:hypothetical protein D3C76_1201390 [compost metagenome]